MLPVSKCSICFPLLVSDITVNTIAAPERGGNTDAGQIIRRHAPWVILQNSKIGKFAGLNCP